LHPLLCRIRYAEELGKEPAANESIEHEACGAKYKRRFGKVKNLNIQDGHISRMLKPHHYDKPYDLRHCCCWDDSLDLELGSHHMKAETDLHYLVFGVF
jgi:hypothetical protein